MPTDPTAAAASTWRDWHFGDEACTYRDGCSLPLRTHTHLNPGPGQPIRVVYYDKVCNICWFGETPKTPVDGCPCCENAHYGGHVDLDGNQQ